MTDLNVSVLVQMVDRLSRPLRKVQDGLGKAGRETEKTQKALAAVERSAGRGGFDRLAKSAERYGRQLKNNEVRLRAISRLESRRAGLMDKLGQQRGSLAATGAAGIAAGAPIVAAARVEQAEIRLRTVINSEDKDAAVLKARTAARDLARTGLVGLTEALDIQYALNSAGLQADAAASAAEVVAKVAKVTSGAPEQVAEVVAGTYNNMSENMVGTTQEKLTRIGELLTKTQFKFQIRDFGQLGEGLSYAAASAASAKVPIETLATVLGVLNSSQVTGSRAGTAFSAVQRNMSKAAEEFGFEIKRSADGQMDFIGTLEGLEESLSVYDDLDERNDALQEAFGEEGKAGIVPLLAKLKELRAAQSDVVDGSKGIVDANAKLFTDSTAGQWDRTVNSVMLLADSFGKTLLPGVNAVLGPIAALVSGAADMAERFPTVTAVIGGVVTAAIAARAAFLAARVASLLMGAGMLTGQIGLLKFGAGLIGLATRAVPMLITGIRAITLAMAANPIGLIIVGIATVAALVIANWEKVSAFFSGLWDSVLPYLQAGWDKIKGLLSFTPLGLIISNWQPIADWLGSLFDGIASRISGVFDWITDKIAGVTQTVGKVTGWLSDTFGIGDESGETLIRRIETKVVEPARQAAAAVVVGTAAAASPAAAAAAPMSPPVVNITVNAAAGQDAEAIAREVKRILDRETEPNSHE